MEVAAGVPNISCIAQITCELHFANAVDQKLSVHPLLRIVIKVLMFFFFVSGHSWFHGPWFISPADTQHLPTRMFYEKEVFLSSLEETVSVGNISGKCCVLPFREYARCELNFLFLLLRK